MDVRLLVTKGCTSCQEAERVWSALAREQGFPFTVVDTGTPEAVRLAGETGLEIFPALFIDGRLKAVGVQDKAQALALVQGRTP
jgi:glutaredoxin